MGGATSEQELIWSSGRSRAGMWIHNSTTHSSAAGKGRALPIASASRRLKELGLPVDEESRVHYPDVQIEYTDREGHTDCVNVEVATKDYRDRSIQVKAAAGFVIHGNGRGGTRVSRALGRSGS